MPHNRLRLNRLINPLFLRDVNQDAFHRGVSGMQKGRQGVEAFEFNGTAETPLDEGAPGLDEHSELLQFSGNQVVQVMRHEEGPRVL